MRHSLLAALSLLIIIIAIPLIGANHMNAQTFDPQATPELSTTLPPPTQFVTATSTPEAALTVLEQRIDVLEKKLERPPKDIWDKIYSISGLLSGILIAIIGGLATYVYREREKNSQEAQKKRELAILEVQTIQGFMPHLQSGDPKTVEAALLAITALGNAKLAIQLAGLFQTDGALSALLRLSTSSDQSIAQQAEQSFLKTISGRNIWESIGQALVSTQDLIVGGLHLRNFINTYFELLVERINAGAHIRFMLLNPNSPDVETIASRMGIKPEHLKDKIFSSLERLNGIQNQTRVIQSSRGSVEVRLLNKMPPYNFVLNNPSEPNGTIILTTITYGSFVAESPQIIIDKSSELFEIVAKNCESLWDTSESSFSGNA